MADQGLNIEINATVTGLNEALRNATKAFSDMGKNAAKAATKLDESLKKLQSGTKKSGDAADKASKKKKKLGDTFQALSKSMRAFGPRLNKLAFGLSGLASAANPVAGIIAGVTTAMGALAVPLGLVADGIKAVIGVASTLAKAMAAAGSAVAAFAAGAVASFAKFESGFAQVKTLLQDGVDDATFNNMSDGLRRLGREMGVDMPTASKAMYDAISAGISEVEVLGFLETSFKMAAGGATTAKQATDLLTSALASFQADGMTAARASDILFATVEKGKTTVSQLASSFGQVGPIAAASGVSMEELGAAMAALTKTGLSTAEASTQISSLLANIIKPAKEGGQELAGFGITLKELQTPGVGLAGILERFRTATKEGAEGFDKLQTKMRATKAIIGLAGKSYDEFLENLKRTKDSTGAAQSAFDTMAATINFTFARIQETVKDTFRSIGEALSGQASKGLKAFLDFVEDTRTEVVALAGVLKERFGSALSKTLGDLFKTMEESGGLVSLVLNGISIALNKVGGFLNQFSVEITVAVQALKVIYHQVVGLKDVLHILASMVLVPLAVGFDAVATAVAYAASGIARLVGIFDKDASSSIESFAQGLNNLGSDVRNFFSLGSVMDSMGNVIDTAGSIATTLAASGGVNDSIKSLGQRSKDASFDVQDLTKEMRELEEANKKAAEGAKKNDAAAVIEENNKRAQKALENQRSALELRMGVQKGHLGDFSSGGSSAGGGGGGSGGGRSGGGGGIGGGRGSSGAAGSAAFSEDILAEIKARAEIIESAKLTAAEIEDANNRRIRSDAQVAAKVSEAVADIIKSQKAGSEGFKEASKRFAEYRKIVNEGSEESKHKLRVMAIQGVSSLEDLSKVLDQFAHDAEIARKEEDGLASAALDLRNKHKLLVTELTAAEAAMDKMAGRTKTYRNDMNVLSQLQGGFKSDLQSQVSLINLLGDAFASFDLERVGGDFEGLKQAITGVDPEAQKFKDTMAALDLAIKSAKTDELKGKLEDLKKKLLELRDKAVDPARLALVELGKVTGKTGLVSSIQDLQDGVSTLAEKARGLRSIKDFFSDIEMVGPVNGLESFKDVFEDLEKSMNTASLPEKYKDMTTEAVVLEMQLDKTRLLMKALNKSEAQIAETTDMLRESYERKRAKEKEAREEAKKHKEEMERQKKAMEEMKDATSAYAEIGLGGLAEAVHKLRNGMASAQEQFDAVSKVQDLFGDLNLSAPNGDVVEFNRVLEDLERRSNEMRGLGKLTNEQVEMKKQIDLAAEALRAQGATEKEVEEITKSLTRALEDQIAAREGLNGAMAQSQRQMSESTAAGLKMGFGGRAPGQYSANYANDRMAALGEKTGLGPKALAQKIRQAGGMANFANQQGIRSFDKGGFVSRDQIAQVHSGEFVMNRKSVDQLGIAFLEAINRSAGGGSTSINNTINMGEGVGLSAREQARALVPEIERAVRLGIAGRKVL